jgi:hypothetical protein
MDKIFTSQTSLFWYHLQDVPPCCLVEVYLFLRNILPPCSGSKSTLKKQAACTIQCNILKDSALQSCNCQNLKSHTVILFILLQPQHNLTSSHIMNTASFYNQEGIQLNQQAMCSADSSKAFQVIYPQLNIIIFPYRYTVRSLPPATYKFTAIL